MAINVMFHGETNMDKKVIDIETIINVSNRAIIDGQIQDLIKQIADYYFDGEIELAINYFKLMGECIGLD